ncbi:hypothetical protein FACS189499_08220 [Clostridia bacterium]|nr:hypothetical protein FACS189499_08220 [Clostridia bacterium]
MKQRDYIISAGAALIAILGITIFLIYKLGQRSVYLEKWKDYDDCGWA